MTPFPIRLEIVSKGITDNQPSAETHRNLFCPRYDKCLNEAVKKGWPGFSCIQCESFHAAPTAQDKKQRSEGLEAYATQRRGEL